MSATERRWSDSRVLTSAFRVDRNCCIGPNGQRSSLASSSGSAPRRLPQCDARRSPGLCRATPDARASSDDHGTRAIAENASHGRCVPYPHYGPGPRRERGTCAGACMEGPSRRFSLSSRLAGCAPLAPPSWGSATNCPSPRGPWWSRRRAVDPHQNCGFLVQRRGMGVDENGVTVPQSAGRKVAHPAPRRGLGPCKACVIAWVQDRALWRRVLRRSPRTRSPAPDLEGVRHKRPRLAFERGAYLRSSLRVPRRQCLGVRRCEGDAGAAPAGPQAVCRGCIQTTPPWSKLPS